jgi:hypothetical protein
MVVAGPGTGKTQILTLRIANILLKTQINPDNILALTFTYIIDLRFDSEQLYGLIFFMGYPQSFFTVPELTILEIIK